MATFFDIGLLQTFDIIFPVLLTFALVFAILQKTKIIGESTSINAVIAVAVSFMVLLSRTIIDLINFIIPWFTVAIIFFILLLLIFQVFGAKEADILSALKKDKAISWVIIGVALMIIFVAFGNVMGQKFTEAAFQPGTTVNATTGATASASYQQNLISIIFHPKVLGLMVLFAIAIFAVALLTG